MVEPNERNLQIARQVIRKIARVGKRRLRIRPPVRGKPSLSKTSVEAYQYRLRRMMEIMDYENEYMVLQKPGEVMRKLHGMGYSTATLKNNVTTVLAVLKKGGKSVQSKVSKEAQDMWKRIFSILKQKQQAQYEKSEPTDKQKRHYVSFHEMKQKVRTLEKTDAYKTDFRTHMQWLFLRFTLGTHPKRRDLGRVAIIEDPAAEDMEALDRQKVNYVVVGKPNNPRLVIGECRKTNCLIVEPLSTQVDAAIRKSIKLFPRRFLFVSTRNRQPFKTPEAFGQFVRLTVFASLFDGRKQGVSLIRHGFVNAMNFDELSVEERKHAASLMGHSIDSQALNYKWKSAPRKQPSGAPLGRS